MTENEIKIKLEVLKDWVGNDSLTRQDMQNVIDEAIKALEEIQQYRAIGTVEGYENAIKAYTETYILMKEYKSKLQGFEAIGTVEEFKTLKECLYVDERPFCFVCPNCKEVYTLEKDERPSCCRKCNEKIDWNNVIFYQL